MKIERPKTIRLGTSRLVIHELVGHVQVLMYNDDSDTSQVCYSPGRLVALSIDPLEDGAALSTLSEGDSGRYHATVIFTKGSQLFHHRHTLELDDIESGEELTLKYLAGENCVTIDSWTRHKTLQTVSPFIPE